MNDTEVRLINAYELERMVKERCGLEGIKLIEIIRDCKTADALPLKRANDRPFFFYSERISRIFCIASLLSISGSSNSSIFCTASTSNFMLRLYSFCVW